MQIHVVERLEPLVEELEPALGGQALGHAPAWPAILEEAYGIPCICLAARSQGACRGLVSLAFLRGLSGRANLVSLPFLDSGGVLAWDAEVEAALLKEAARLGSARGVREIELRQDRPLRTVASVDAPRVAMTLELPEDPEALWRSLPGKVRNQARKALREGLSLAVGGQELLGPFYEVHRTRMRELGSPVHARRFFDAVARHFGDALRVVVAWSGDLPVGALIAIRHGDAVSVPWASTRSSHNRLCPNQRVYWEALRLAVLDGASRFEFGRSAVGSGTHRFKRGWGARERPLPWTRLAPDGSVAPVRTPGASPGLVALSRVWRRLPPALCDHLGPRVRAHIAS